MLPTRRYFPRAGERSIEEIEDAFERIAGFLGVPAGSVGLWLYEPDEEPLAQYRDQWSYVGLRTDQGADPAILVAVLAHELAHARLHDHLTGRETREEHERLTDLATVFLGLGLFTANAILQERKGHDGLGTGAFWSLGRLGYLRGPEFGYALAVFAWWRGERQPAWKQFLRRDVAVPFRQTPAFFEHSAGVNVPGGGRYPPGR